MGDVPTLTTAQVQALAPDPASAKAGQSQASPAKWQQAGHTDTLIWGYCQGSGKTPYQAIVDLTGPAFKCSCPSRKFPCKHAIGLMLLYAANQVPQQREPADFAESWFQSRQERAEKAAVPKAAPSPEAQAKRAEQRGGRAKEGLQELDRWLQDQVRTGLAGTDRKGYSHFDQVAARMVDAQVPGVAGTLRNIASIPSSGTGWPERLLGELGMIRLLTQAHARLDHLDPDLADTIRTHVGYPVSKEDVLATSPVRDQWHVIAIRDSADTHLNTRRVWLQGTTTEQYALVLSFAPSGQPLDTSLIPNTVLDADLHFYPGKQPMRALVSARHELPINEPGPPRTNTMTQILEAAATAMANDPWLQSWPAVVTGTPQRQNDTWILANDEGQVVTLIERDKDLYRLLAISGGHPIIVAGEWTPTGFLPLTAWEQTKAVAI